jgi:hypothetical protein
VVPQLGILIGRSKKKGGGGRKDKKVGETKLEKEKVNKFCNLEITRCSNWRGPSL